MSARNLNPHAEARVAMALWSERYSKQTLGCMDFYDGLTAAQKSTCAQIVDGIIYADRADGRTPAPSTISVLTSDPIAWAEVYDEKIVAVQLDKSKWHTTPLYLSAPAELSVGIKPLEWKELVREDRKAEVADTILGRWEIWQFPGGGTYIMKPGEHQGTVFEDSYDEAKAHMERAYRRRIAPPSALRR